MTTATISKTITQPVDVINEFADNLGYMSTVSNPDYVPAQGLELMRDPNDPEQMILNPEYVPAVGEPTMDNPMSRVEFVSMKFDEMASDWFAQFARRNAERTVREQIEQTVVATKEAIKATIATEIK
jgi:hypothetical protein